MKKLLILAICLIVVLASFPNSYAKTRYRTFEVAEIVTEGIVLMDFEGKKFLVEKDPAKIKGGLKVGDSVRYDPSKNRLKKSGSVCSTFLSASMSWVEISSAVSARENMSSTMATLASMLAWITRMSISSLFRK